MDVEANTSVETEATTQEQEVESTETKGSDETKQSEYDKTQQALDQERANARKARLRAQELEDRNQQLTEQLSGLQEKVSTIEGQLKQDLTKKEFASVMDLDPDTTDVPDLVRAYQAAMQKVSTLERTVEEKNSAVQKWIEQQEAAMQKTAAQRAHDNLVEDIYVLCDEEYGAQFRNDAISLADDLVAKGEVDLPKTEVQAIRLMRRCYKEVADKKPKPKGKEKTVSSDTGLRGTSPFDLEGSEEFKPGPADDVLADMAKKMKSGKWQRAFAGPS